MKLKISLITLILLTFSSQLFSQIQLQANVPGIKYEKQYEFDAEIGMDMIFYNKKGAHRMTIPYVSNYSNDKNYICIKILRKNSVYQTLFDFPNNNCLILLGEGESMNATSAVMKDNEGRDLRTLPLTRTEKKKDILGYHCHQFTFNTDRFHGEIWVTKDLDLPNDVGLLKASKMGKFYEDIPVDGFVLEITSITPKGLKTEMKTTSINPDKKHTVTLPAEVGPAINKIDYYDY